MSPTPEATSTLVAVHWPALHAAPRQSWPQAPQSCPEVVTSTQVPAQLTSVPVQPGAPLLDDPLAVVAPPLPLDEALDELAALTPPLPLPLDEALVPLAAPPPLPEALAVVAPPLLAEDVVDPPPDPLPVVPPPAPAGVLPPQAARTIRAPAAAGERRERMSRGLSGRGSRATRPG
jgi:hypothetical protein